MKFNKLIYYFSAFVIALNISFFFIIKEYFFTIYFFVLETVLMTILIRNLEKKDDEVLRK